MCMHDMLIPVLPALAWTNTMLVFLRLCLISFHLFVVLHISIDFSVSKTKLVLVLQSL